jgi:hypothetical protein
MFNKIKSFFENVINNIKYVLHGIKNLFVKAEECVSNVATGKTEESVTYEALEKAASGAMVATAVAALLLASKMLFTAKTFTIIMDVVGFVTGCLLARFLMVYGAKDFCPDGSAIVIRNIWDKKEEADATE